MLELVATHLCPVAARGGQPLKSVAGLPGGGVAAGGQGGEVFFTLGSRASTPGFGQTSGAALLLLHEGSVGCYKLL